MPKSRNRKNHKTKVKNYKNKQREVRNGYTKWLNAIKEINSGNTTVEPEYNYVSGGLVGNSFTTTLTPTPESNDNNYE